MRALPVEDRAARQVLEIDGRVASTANKIGVAKVARRNDRVNTRWWYSRPATSLTLRGENAITCYCPIVVCIPNSEGARRTGS